ncbi:30S ribosomal protein S9, mitochondrial-like [Zingiber officinale]|uniref:30S ribosomal protein S9, mitochondrial-like n=1 Tax=Zingiber officinale TaxID=94328 RepID=UPI001C4B08AF|nr:30S ribosomal protein S9, mitochondrial-like [Zingiber officinale]XP_042379503.1 30S ribosomal protein S9, mitochondrial-like [Zingiber officinale]XP_042379504.1 30S ribosomal protein S9, mitochondrial-like [Zingiber officinale]XP_042379506.1 30S ribosomal protein S9, mitochondrial-like [Zingiber officinale]
MLSRSASFRQPLRFLALTAVASFHPCCISPPPPPPPLSFPRLPCPLFPPSNSAFFQYSKAFSSGSRDDGGDWKLTPEEDEGGFVFPDEGDLAGISDDAPRPSGTEAINTGAGIMDQWEKGYGTVDKGDIFDGLDGETLANENGLGGLGVEEWETAEGYKPWSLGDDDEKLSLFNDGDGGVVHGGVDDLEKSSDEQKQQLEKREKELLDILEGPKHAFGDLTEASGITDDMIDSLIILKDVTGVPGLPPLKEIQEEAIAKMNATSTRTEIERKKQEEIAKSRVRQVDEKGRAYGTGRRKCSVARVWIKPGDGTFIVNDKQFDVYFPILDHRAELLRPFTVTKTLGLWDVNCTVKGGGVSGQVGAIRLGISRALQCWEPGLRPYLKAAGYLTRDPRVVERKKPGKAKARKSFQWVKR